MRNWMVRWKVSKISKQIEAAGGRLWVQPVSKLGSEERRRNNRLGNCGRVNHYCL